MKNILWILVIQVCCLQSVWATRPSFSPTKKASSSSLNTRQGPCVAATKQIDQEINNVRARLLNGGDVWWDLDKGRYIIPKVEAGSGKAEVSSLYAGGVWVGGYDPAGALKFMGQTYRRSTANDCWPGPLMETGETCTEDCLNWDQFFKVSGANITKLKAAWSAAKAANKPQLDRSEIPSDVLYWPGKGNQYFESRYGFKLPDARQGLALFFEEEGSHKNGIYEPQFGEFPVIDIRGCPKDIYPDEMIFWIYNDAGGIHTNTQGSPIRMEVQVQAFAFRTADELNDMTFQRYKLINRAPQEINQCYFAMWTDPDLGCFSDDYIGCDTTKIKGKSRDLMYIYNIDATDGTNGCQCPSPNSGSVNTYCQDVPILGIDYFRGPTKNEFVKDVNGNDSLVKTELGMSTFMYYNNPSGGGNPNSNTTDPGNSTEFYYYITGRWKDGSDLTVGGTGYNPGSTNVTKYAFPAAPNAPTGWSMCTAASGEGDRRTIQASGPLVLGPGDVNELIIGVPWVPDQVYPCPSLDELLKADQLCQDLFDNCFKIKDGPTAPDVDIVELDQEIVLILSNDPASNNANEQYQEKGLGFPPVIDSVYRFEGYRIFQLASADVSLSDRTIEDPSLIREVATVDLKNKITTVTNWVGIKNPNASVNRPIIYYPVKKVEGFDQGIRHTFSIKEDQFATGLSKNLINHKKYYFLVLAYSYNNYADFDADLNAGQRMQYCPGRLNLGPDGDGRPYTAVPRPQVYEKVKSKYGDGIEITRHEGIGVGHNFVRLNNNMYEKFFNGLFDGKIDYREGSGPLEVKIVNPLIVKDGEYEFRFVDKDMTNGKLDTPEVNWTLINKNNPSEVIKSKSSIARFNEQMIAKFGFSVSIGQTGDVSSDVRGTNGIIGEGLEYEYKDVNGIKWFIGQRDRNSVQIDFIKTELSSTNNQFDPNELYSNLGTGIDEGTWYPYKLVTGDTLPLTPGWLNSFNNTITTSMRMDSLNNVDIVFTADKSKWSRCVVIETWNENNSPTPGNPKEPVTGNRNFDVKKSPSVGKNDANGDGYADADGDVDATGKPLTGMGWFPGYAIDVETGRRLNIFFGENSFYSDFPLIKDCMKDTIAVGNDLMFNPTDQTFLNTDCSGFNFFDPLNIVLGGHHYIYVTKQPYDSCRAIRTNLLNTGVNFKLRAIREITWCSMMQLFPLTSFTPLTNGPTGLIPNDLTVRLRVDNPYNALYGTGENMAHNMYSFKIAGKQTEIVTTKDDYKGILDDINVVPNPYYGFSSYEQTVYSNIVKITNLPPKCKVTIFSIDGKFIKEYNRDELPKKIISDERGLLERQIGPDIEWDLTNYAGVPISSGAYLIYIKQPDTGVEKIIKWFGVARKFDPSGL